MRPWGVGLRPQHFAAWIEAPRSVIPAISSPMVLEVMADNLLGHRGGPALWHTDRLAARYPLTLHGVGLNLGSTDACDERYLAGLCALIERYGPSVVSDHLSFTRAGGLSSFELLPVERSARSLTRLVERIHLVQERLNTRLSLENVSAYAEHLGDSWSEGEFFAELVRRTGCGVLLDVNNLYVNAFNFKRSATEELALFPLEAVTQVHIAGHTDCGTYLFDTHDQPVLPAVGELLRLVLPRLPDGVPLILESDDPLLSHEALLAELARVQAMAEGSLP